MSTYRVLTPPSPNKILNAHTGRNAAIGLIATAVIIVILTSGVLCATSANGINKNLGNDPDYVPTPHTVSVISESIVANPNGYYFTGFCVPEDALSPVLQGNFTSTGNSTNNSVIVTVWSQTNFINWLNGRQSTPCYNKDLMPMVTGNINVTLSSGQYFIVFGSASMEAKKVLAQIDLTYSK
jgi:hypothetical protein